jgi:hypothetical protein
MDNKVLRSSDKNIKEKLPDTLPNSGYSSNMTDSQEADGDLIKAVEAVAYRPE